MICCWTKPSLRLPPTLLRIFMTGSLPDTAVVSNLSHGSCTRRGGSCGYLSTNTVPTSNSVPKPILELEPNISGLTDRTGHHPTTINYKPEVIVQALQLMHRVEHLTPHCGIILPFNMTQPFSPDKSWPTRSFPNIMTSSPCTA